MQALVNAFYKTLKWIATATTDEIVNTVPQDYFLGDREIYVKALRSNLLVYSKTGVLTRQGMNSALNMLATFDPELKGAKIDLQKTFDDRFMRRATVLFETPTTPTWKKTTAGPRSISRRSAGLNAALTASTHNRTTCSKKKEQARRKPMQQSVSASASPASVARRRALVASGLVEDHGYADRDHPGSGLRHSRRAAGGLHLHRRHQGRSLDDDRRAGRSGASPAPRSASALPMLRNIGAGGDLRDLHSLGARLLQAAAAADREVDRRIHEVHQFPVSVHRLHHRRQHPGDGPAGSGQGLREDLRAARRRLDRRGHGRHAGRHAAGPRRLSHLLFRRGSDHGRRRRRRRDPAFDRLFGNPRTNRRATCSRRCCRR